MTGRSWVSIDPMRTVRRKRSNIIVELFERIDVLLCLSLLLLLTGCGSGEPAGSVSGTVTLDGQPLTKGEIGFVSSTSGEGASAEIQAGGSFRMTASIPPGEYTVTVSPPPPPPPTPQTMNNPPLPSDIPQKYRSAQTSDLVFEVEDGSNSFEVKLAK